MSRLLALPALLWCLAAAAEPPPLIARDVLLGNPEKTRPELSPDGKRLAYLAPDPKNVLQVWVRTVGQADDAVVTDDKKRGIRRFSWAADSSAVLFLQDADGDENFHLFHVDLSTRNIRDLTPFQGVKADLLGVSPKFKDVVLVTLNLRDRKAFDVHRISLKTGGVELDTQNPGDVTAWVTDPNFAVRGAVAMTSDGSTELRVRDSVKLPWRSLVKAGLEESLALHGFSLDGKSVFVSTTIDTDTRRVVVKSCKTGSERVLAKNDKSDSDAVLMQPTRFALQAVAFDVGGRTEWTVLDSTVRADFEGLKGVAPGDLAVISRDEADTTWLAAFTSDTGGVRFFTWDRAAKKGTFLFAYQPKLEGLPLAEMKPQVIKARDGLELPAYLSVPPGSGAGPLPLVLLVHGGPWARDSWGFNPQVQLLANRGYAVLQVNFRGSTGFGKRFLNAGNKQWGLAMHDDLLDAVQWAVAQGVADPKKVCIMGGSYGGYAALAGAAFTPDVFRCAVDIVGPSNLFTLMKTIPPYWAPMKATFARRLGDVDDPKDQELLKKASPLFSADKIRIPLLIGQGANDPRVKQAESEQIVAAMEKNGLPVTYVVYPDEGHGFARPENRTDFYARAEAFLAQHLGGRAEPLPPSGKVAGSTGTVKVISAAKKK